jgi:hypothetical protein
MLTSFTRFRVHTPFLAICQRDRKAVLFTLATGSILETPSDLEEPGLIKIKVGEENLFAFVRDILERCDALKLPCHRLPIGG